MNVLRTLQTSLLLLSLAGCRLIEATDWNLDQLHGEQSRHRRLVQLESHLGYFVGHTLGELVGGSEPAGGRDGETAGGDGDGRREGKGIGGPRPVEAPEAHCLAELRDLAQYNPSTPRVAALQVSWFSRLAVEDPWTLCRERAVLELGTHGKRLGLQRLDLAGLGDGETAAGAPWVARVLARLVKGTRADLAGGRTADAEGDAGEQRGELELACAEVKALPLDLAGARRLLRGTAHLVGSASAQGAARAPLEDVARHLERTCVARALAQALADRAPQVRAAAIAASVEAVGPLVLADFVAQLEGFPEEVERVRLFSLIEQHGLPLSQDVSSARREARREGLMVLLVRRAHDPLDSGRTRVAAMGALGRLAPDGPRSLREEEWGHWLRERLAGSGGEGDTNDGDGVPVAAEPAGEG